MEMTARRQMRVVPCNYLQGGDQYLPTDDQIKEKSLFSVDNGR